MKKVLSLLMVLTLFLSISACGETTDEPNDNNDDNGTTDPNDDGDPGDDVEQTYDLQGQEFIVFVDSPNTTDPRKDTFNGLHQSQKADLIDEVEQRFGLFLLVVTHCSGFVYRVPSLLVHQVVLVGRVRVALNDP